MQNVVPVLMNVARLMRGSGEALIAHALRESLLVQLLLNGSFTGLVQVHTGSHTCFDSVVDAWSCAFCRACYAAPTMPAACPGCVAATVAASTLSAAWMLACNNTSRGSAAATIAEVQQSHRYTTNRCTVRINRREVRLGNRQVCLQHVSFTTQNSY